MSHTHAGPFRLRRRTLSGEPLAALLTHHTHDALARALSARNEQDAHMLLTTLVRTPCARAEHESPEPVNSYV